MKLSNIKNYSSTSGITCDVNENVNCGLIEQNFPYLSQIGKAYNLTKLNYKDLQVIGNTVYEITDDNKYKYLNAITESTSEFDTYYQSNREEFIEQNYKEASVSTGINMGFLSVKADASIKIGAEFTKDTKMVSISYKGNKTLATFNINDDRETYNTLIPTDNFINDLNIISTDIKDVNINSPSYDFYLFDAFILKWGTHIVNKISLGISYEKYYCLQSDSSTALTTLNAHVRLQASIPSVGGLDNNTEISESTKNTMNQSNIIETTNIIGGSSKSKAKALMSTGDAAPNTGADNSKTSRFADLVNDYKNYPGILDVGIIPIQTVIDRINTNGIYTKLKSSFDTYFDILAGNSNIQLSGRFTIINLFSKKSIGFAKNPNGELYLAACIESTNEIIKRSPFDMREGKEITFFSLGNGLLYSDVNNLSSDTTLGMSYVSSDNTSTNGPIYDVKHGADLSINMLTNTSYFGWNYTSDKLLVTPSGFCLSYMTNTTNPDVENGKDSLPYNEKLIFDNPDICLKNQWQIRTVLTDYKLTFKKSSDNTLTLISYTRNFDYDNSVIIQCNPVIKCEMYTYVDYYDRDGNIWVNYWKSYDFSYVLEYLLPNYLFDHNNKTIFNLTTESYYRDLQPIPCILSNKPLYISFNNTNGIYAIDGRAGEDYVTYVELFKSDIQQFGTRLTTTLNINNDTIDNAGNLILTSYNIKRGDEVLIPQTWIDPVTLERNYSYTTFEKDGNMSTMYNITDSIKNIPRLPTKYGNQIVLRITQPRTTYLNPYTFNFNLTLNIINCYKGHQTDHISDRFKSNFPLNQSGYYTFYEIQFTNFYQVGKITFYLEKVDNYFILRLCYIEGHSESFQPDIICQIGYYDWGNNVFSTYIIFNDVFDYVLKIIDKTYDVSMIKSDNATNLLIRISEPLTQDLNAAISGLDGMTVISAKKTYKENNQAYYDKSGSTMEIVIE